MTRSLQIPHPTTSTLCSSPARSLLHWLFSSFKCRLSSASLPLTPATSRRLRCSSAMVRSRAPAALANSSPRRAAFCWLEAASSWAPRSCSFRGSSSALGERRRWNQGSQESSVEPGRQPGPSSPPFYQDLRTRFFSLEPCLSPNLFTTCPGTFATSCCPGASLTTRCWAWPRVSFIWATLSFSRWA